MRVTPVVLCGGSGTRLWPLSRAGFPKQFLVLSGTQTLFQQALIRLNALGGQNIEVGEPIIVTGEEHRFLVLEQLRELGELHARLLLEPVPKNTAPALTLAAFQATKDGQDPVLVVSPADQTVQDSNAFTQSLQNAIRVAETGALVILGVKPSSPETGFGYIKHSKGVGERQVYDVETFTEKPDAKTAQRYLDSGDYSWNSGMFVVRASVWLRALAAFRLDILKATEQAFKGSRADGQFLRPDLQAFEAIPSESVDYAVIEKCPGSGIPIEMVKLEAGWSDLGAWDAVWQVGEKDLHQNVMHGDVVLDETKGSLIFASHRLVGVVGLENLVVVETADAVLVADRQHSQHVKNIVGQLGQRARQEHLIHRKVARPWGWYDTVDLGDGFKVKRIGVNPGASLSLQRHEKRAEHWVVVRGRAEVTTDQQAIILQENESTYIPVGGVHRLANPFDVPLEIIEVQTGQYLGEDDIIRLEDQYGR